MQRAASQIASCFYAIAVLAGFSSQSPASACGSAEYRQAAVLLADSSLRVDSSTDAAEQSLRACGDDPMAAYLIGMLPRFAEFSAERREGFRRSLSSAAERGVAAAALAHGAWLVDTNTDRERGGQLIADAYAAEDEWGVGMGLTTLTGRQERLSDAALARLEQLAEDGFPWAYGILAYQRMLRISDHRASSPPEQQMAAIMEAHNAALKGTLRGDSIAVLVMNHIAKELDAESKASDYLIEVLNAADPLTFVSSHPKEMQQAHVSWQATTVFHKVDDETLRLMKMSANVCSSRIPSQWKELCEVRAVGDHYVCMRPFGAYMDESAWMSSSAYRTCRLLRLRVLASAPYY
jgi:hypothetical protein